MNLNFSVHTEGYLSMAEALQEKIGGYTGKSFVEGGMFEEGEFFSAVKLCDKVFLCPNEFLFCNARALGSILVFYSIHDAFEMSFYEFSKLGHIRDRVDGEFFKKFSGFVSERSLVEVNYEFGLEVFGPYADVSSEDPELLCVSEIVRTEDFVSLKKDLGGYVMTLSGGEVLEWGFLSPCCIQSNHGRWFNILPEEEDSVDVTSHIKRDSILDNLLMFHPEAELSPSLALYAYSALIGASSDAGLFPATFDYSCLFDVEMTSMVRLQELMERILKFYDDFDFVILNSREDFRPIWEDLIRNCASRSNITFGYVPQMDHPRRKRMFIFDPFAGYLPDCFTPFYIDGYDFYSKLGSVNDAMGNFIPRLRKWDRLLGLHAGPIEGFSYFKNCGRYFEGLSLKYSIAAYSITDISLDNLVLIGEGDVPDMDVAYAYSFRERENEIVSVRPQSDFIYSVLCDLSMSIMLRVNDVDQYMLLLQLAKKALHMLGQIGVEGRLQRSSTTKYFRYTGGRRFPCVHRFNKIVYFETLKVGGSRIANVQRAVDFYHAVTVFEDTLGALTAKAGWNDVSSFQSDPFWFRNRYPESVDFPVMLEDCLFHSDKSVDSSEMKFG